MKRAAFLILVMFLAVPASVFCQGQAVEALSAAQEEMAHPEQAADAQAKEGRCCDMHAKKSMMGMMGMMKKEMAVTPDGGVIVMSGSSLLKYDKNLNLVKEARIKKDFTDMKKMKEKMGHDCPVHKQMMEEDSSGAVTQPQAE